jgi:hypothetical protein
MKPLDIFKDIFSLAVKVLGLYFFYIGLKDLDVPALTDLTIIRSDNLDDVFSALLAVIFNLAVAWWLLGSKVLISRAYPVATKRLDHALPPAQTVTPTSTPTKPPGSTGLETAEEKLAGLVCESKAEFTA